jgi:hypothetical protein
MAVNTDTVPEIRPEESVAAKNGRWRHLEAATCYGNVDEGGAFSAIKSAP